MPAVIIALLVGWFAAAAVGVFVSGLFWLTVVAFGVLLLTGAVGLTLLPPAVEEGDARRAAVKADVVLISGRRSCSGTR